ncbi:MAG: hypothetical protein M3527_09785, partial [Actinomycetota bacterium]|nr:hypothetical protein [Actinomycetota bacterium]
MRRLASALLVATMLAAGCGSRLPDDVLVSIDAATFGDGSGGGTGDGSTAGAVPGPGGRSTAT